MTYTTPVLKKLGPVTSLTLGNNGSCLDGNETATQRGGGSTCGVSGGNGPK
jgi:hypothetical protein